MPKLADHDCCPPSADIDARNPMRKLQTAALVTTLLLLAATLLAQRDASQSASYVGRWKLNTQKSDFGKVPAPKSAMVVVTDSAGTVKWYITGVNAQGKKTEVSYDGTPDGNEHAISGGGRAQTVAHTRGEGNTLELNIKMKDGSTAHETIALSEDGNTMTVKGTASGVDGESHWTEVFDRVAGAKKMKAAAGQK